MPHFLSKSDFKVAQTCPTKLFYKKSGYPSANQENDYLMMLAEGGYMVEKIAKLLQPEGREVGYAGTLEQAAQETLKALDAEQVTLFEATLLSDGKLARVDILKRSGNCFDLIEVKAKSYDSDENEAAVDAGRPNLFRTKKGDGIITGWREYLEDVAYQVMMLQELFPKATIRPFLMMPDKSKTTQIDRIHSLFRLQRIQQPGRKFTSVAVEFTGDADQLRKDHFLTQVSVEAEVKLLLPEVKTAAETYLASLQPELRKISTPISVGCRGCEYRFSVENDRRDGFKECWKELADIKPHLLDLYHVSSVGGRGGPVVNDLRDFSNFTIRYPTNELAAKAWYWMGDCYRLQGQLNEEFYKTAESNYQNVYLNFPASELYYRAQMEAGRTAIMRRDYSDAATNYFDPLADEAKCPAKLKMEAAFACGDAYYLASNFTKATNWFLLVANTYTNDPAGISAWGRVGDSCLQLAALAEPNSPTNAMNYYLAASNAYQMVLTPPLLARADITNRSLADYGLGMTLEKMARLKTGDERTNCLESAVTHFFNVITQPDLRPGEAPDPFVIRDAALAVGDLLEKELGRWREAYSVYKQVRDYDLPQLKELQEELDKKMQNARKHLPPDMDW